MASGGRTWKRTSVHRVISEWLLAERAKVEGQVSGWRNGTAMLAIIDRPDLSSHLENRLRLRVFYMIRMEVVVEIPPDVVWYTVHSFTHDDVLALNIIRSTEWCGEDGGTGIVAVSQRRKIDLTSDPSTWPMPVLFGTSRDGPFTILEGNHRLLAYVGSGRNDLDMPMIVGISPTDCFWHAGTVAGKMQLMGDLIDSRHPNRLQGLERPSP